MSSLPQESVWDYPRPPRLEPTSAHIRIMHGDRTIADTRRALRILETSHPPVYYLPVADVATNLLRPSPARGSFCEFKGTATYWTLEIPQPGIQRDVQPAADPVVVLDAAWSYPSPAAPYAALAGHLAFYASRLASVHAHCWVEHELVSPQPGGFYGGWITSNLRGPFKGAPGTLGW